jgi:hypothetical protein
MRFLRWWLTHQYGEPLSVTVSLFLPTFFLYQQQVQNILKQIHLPKKRFRIFGDYFNHYTARFNQ